MSPENNKYSQQVLNLLKDPTRRTSWETEGILGIFALEAERSMEQQDLSQADLARIVKKSPQAISRALGGQQNLSVRTMVEIALALKRSIKIRLEPLEQLESIKSPIRRTTQIIESYQPGKEKESAYPNVILFNKPQNLPNMPPGVSLESSQATSIAL